jgi:hypothetical protein
VPTIQSQARTSFALLALGAKELGLSGIRATL